MTHHAAHHECKPDARRDQDALDAAREALREILAITLALTAESADPESLLTLLDRRAAALDRFDRALPALDAAGRAGIEPLRAEVASAEERASAALHTRRDAIAEELASVRVSRSAARAYTAEARTPADPRYQDRDA